MTACLSPAVIASYLDGHLSQVERNIAEAHLALCPACLSVLAGTIRTSGEIAAAIEARS